MPRDTGGPSPDERGINVKAEGLKMDLRNARDVRNWGEYVKVAVEIKKQGGTPPLDDECLHNINKMVEQKASQHDWAEFVIVARDMYALGLTPKINDSQWLSVERSLDEMPEESRLAAKEVATKLGKA